MNKDKLLIHLVDGKIVEVEESYIFLDNTFNAMNDNNANIMKGKYIIPKSSINYIEIVHANEDSEE